MYYIDDYGNEYKDLEDARKFFEKKFDERITDIEEFSEELIIFTDLTDILLFLCSKDDSIYDILKEHYSKELKNLKEEYVGEEIYCLERVDN